ncbi:amino acid permease [Pelomonas sp. SE-A7]|uniref:amino acid permease n=1 Tax=Pelomonas sp. SE-A7 TaxID=3054953 RepID=UPI00259D1959|nr:amino acid permease [Pelomonas sp. SE-A7]MDM4766862.1 amino acid permease [Pelomonas sp. SE-A7]
MDAIPQQELKRGIGARQLSMIAIGGAIGTGLFLASGGAIANAGPGGALLAYAIMGIAVFCMMQSLGEMATQLPIAGSFEAYAERFVDPSLGFAFGWNYWFSWSITLAAEFVAGGLIVKFWFPDSNAGLWAMGFFVLLMGLNLLSVKAYAEAEYWFASIKVTTVIIFLIVGALMICGLLGDQQSIGFKNWQLADAASGKSAPFVGGLAAILGVFLIAGFSFQGTEGVGLAAAETEDPARNVPKAIHSVFWRILLFYIGAIAVIGFLIPFTDPNLLRSGEENVAYSPFTIVISHLPKIGFYAANLMNFVILSAVLSAGNSSLYVSSRMLYAMAHSGKAPRLFGQLNGRGVPVAAVWATGLVGALAFLASEFGATKVYQLLYNASGLTGFLIWLGIAICHLRFRKAWVAQGRPLSDLKFRAKFYPWGPWAALVLFLVVLFGANAWVFQAEQFSWFDFISNYLPIPAFVLLYLGHKWVKKTRVVPLKDCNFRMD